MRIKQQLKLVILFIFIDLVSIKAQDFNKKYFTSVLKTISSKNYAGRGYVDGGMDKAASYLEKQYIKNNLKSFQGDYYQSFDYPINIINDAELTINGKKLKYGIDFLVKPSSKSVSSDIKLPFYTLNIAKYKQSFLSKTYLRKFIEEDEILQKNKNIILPPLNSKIDSIQQYYKGWANTYEKDDNTNRAIFRFTSDKLTSSLSQRQSSISEFIIKDKFYTNSQIDSYLIDANFNKTFNAKNIVGYIDGVNNDSTIVITAHYDHLGKVGKTIFPGASDNASGVAMMMSLMDYYKKSQPKYKMVFIAFAGEEAGLLGAEYYVNHPLFPLNEIKFLINLDIMGAGDKGIQVVNGKIYRNLFQKLMDINQNKNYLSEVKIRGESCNSDHCPFYQQSVPSFFIYTLGGKGYYHDPEDKMKNLNLDYSVSVFNLLRDFINII
ncbi:M28 family peptidase [Chishuiella sp.]|uniref:M28 family metallopeptidase n=1 Tax=Chishuiella sp. TaxID=1969467 RepID=UPI0028A6E85C|nr:M28 family peptidase [Chishuiella sp.]